jgi:Na+/glutamate symporter
MGALDTITNGIGTIESTISGFVSDNTAATIGAAAVGGIVTGAVIGSIISSKKKSSKTRKKKSRKTGKKIKHTSRGWKQDRARRSKQKWEVSYQKRKRKHHHSKSRKGKHYTKNGQPYIILASGKARFVKKHK